MGRPSHSSAGYFQVSTPSNTLNSGIFRGRPGTTTRIGRVSAAPVAFLRTTTAPHSVCGARRPPRLRAKARARLAPAAPKPEVAEVDPNTHIAVFGDRLADLVGEGLEEAYDEADDILVVRETHSDSGLADAAAQDWPKIIREFLQPDCGCGRLLPTMIDADGARAGRRSAFKKKQEIQSGWNVVANCSNGRERWVANVRLKVQGERLTWSSERGSQAYVRCEPGMTVAQAN